MSANHPSRTSVDLDQEERRGALFPKADVAPPRSRKSANACSPAIAQGYEIIRAQGYGHGNTQQMGERRMSENVLPPDEHAIRVDLAACYRLVARYGWDDLIFTHISARVPGPEHHFLINAYGMTFDEITASSLVKVDLHGKIVMDTPFNINPAGFVIHSAIHAAR